LAQDLGNSQPSQRVLSGALVTAMSGFSEESSHNLGGVQPQHLLDRLPATRSGKRNMLANVLLGFAAVAFVCALVQSPVAMLGSAAGAGAPAGTPMVPADPKLVQEVLNDMQEALEGAKDENLERGPGVQRLASEVPEVRELLADPAKRAQLLESLHAGARYLKAMKAGIACPEGATCPTGSEELARLTGLTRELLVAVQGVVEDPEFAALTFGLDAPAAPGALGSLAGLFSSASGFQAGARASAPPRASPAMGARKPVAKKKPAAKRTRAPAGDKFKTPPGSDISGSDIGVTEPLGIFDPQGFMTNTGDYAPFPWAPPQPKFKPDDTKYRRWIEMEIKHGRIAMLATLHVFITTLGFKWPYFDLSPGTTGLSETGQAIAFADVPGGTLASWAAIPTFGWAQIVGSVFLFDALVFSQDPEKEPGDVIPDFLPWVRYDDKAPYEAPLGALWPFPGTYTFPSEKAYKLNVERNNGRAAMLGIYGMMIHEYLTGNPVWPIPADVNGGVFAALGIDNPLIGIGNR